MLVAYIECSRIDPEKDEVTLVKGNLIFFHVFNLISHNFVSKFNIDSLLFTKSPSN